MKILLGNLISTTIILLCLFYAHGFTFRLALENAYGKLDCGGNPTAEDAPNGCIPKIDSDFNAPKYLLRELDPVQTTSSANKVKKTRLPIHQKRTNRIERRPPKKEFRKDPMGGGGVSKDPKDKGKGKDPKKDQKGNAPKDPKSNPANDKKQEAFLKTLLELKPAFAKAVREEEDEYEHYADEYDEDDELDFDELGSEDEDELYSAAGRRARSNLFPVTKGLIDPTHDYSNIVIHISESLDDHPMSSVLRAMGLSEYPPTFATVELIDEGSKQNLFETRVSIPQKHLIVGWNEDQDAIQRFVHWVYLSWRSGSSPGRTSGFFSPEDFPPSSGLPLEYITILNVRTSKTLTVLNRVAELPGYRVKSYQDPEQKRNRNAYFFNIDFLSKHDEDSEEKKAVDALFGLQEISSIVELLHVYPNGLYHANIASIFLVIDNDANEPLATILVQLSPADSDQAMKDIDFDKQLPGIDPRLAIIGHTINPALHPLAELLPSTNGPSYFGADASYFLGHKQVEFTFAYSRLEHELIVEGLNDGLSGSDLVHLLNLAWTRQAGLIPILRLTFQGLSAAADDFINKEVESKLDDDGPRTFNFNRQGDSSGGFNAILQKFQASNFNEFEVLNGLIAKDSQNFGQAILMSIDVIAGLGDPYKTYMIFNIEYDSGSYVSNGYLKGLINAPTLLALRRGARSKGKLGRLEMVYQEDEPGMLAEFGEPESRDNYVTTDLSFGAPMIARYVFEPNAKDCKVMATPELVNEVKLWHQAVEAAKVQENSLQSTWRKRMFRAFDIIGGYCMFSLSVKNTGVLTLNENSNDHKFELWISQISGNIIVATKFPDPGDELDVNPALENIADAIWALWIAVDTQSEVGPYLYKESLKSRQTGLRFVTILHPSDQTIATLRQIYILHSLDKTQITIFGNEGYGFEVFSDHIYGSSSTWRRLLLTLNGLPEVFALDDLCRRIFYVAYSILNHRRRVGAVLVRCVEDMPELIIGLGHFTFEQPTSTSTDYNQLSYIRGKPNMAELAEAGFDVSWSVASSYMFERSDLIPPETQIKSEYEVTVTAYMLGCPLDIRDFVRGLPWTLQSDRKHLSEQGVADINHMVNAGLEITPEEKQAFEATNTGRDIYIQYRYLRRFTPCEYEILVRGSPYHLIFVGTKDEQVGPPVLPRITRIERLSEVYFDIFARTLDLLEASKTHWISMRSHELSFDTYTTIRTMWNILTLRIPDWSGFDISFMAGSDPTIEIKEEIEIGKTLLGLVEIGALARMLSDHSRAMHHLRIARIFINRARDDIGALQGSFQIFIILKQQIYQ
ncbi:hypothetical protein H072_7083 [Dactylellina haptotyla CBS 200.50]|uniref:Uncharacterized protein n=1 Tax=Dactylellina haptotyla (strain CBS 200.50) TaxID=1284197 RepID=S8BUZ5_DACHA|nr:hypothetical protein H072_7083 [Dactylellina haptotyla CBS 200.50]